MTGHQSRIKYIWVTWHATRKSIKEKRYKHANIYGIHTNIKCRSRDTIPCILLTNLSLTIPEARCVALIFSNSFVMYVCIIWWFYSGGNLMTCSFELGTHFGGGGRGWLAASVVIVNDSGEWTRYRGGEKECVL